MQQKTKTLMIYFEAAIIMLILVVLPIYGWIAG